MSDLINKIVDKFLKGEIGFNVELDTIDDGYKVYYYSFDGVFKNELDLFDLPLFLDCLKRRLEGEKNG